MTEHSDPNSRAAEPRGTRLPRLTWILIAAGAVLAVGIATVVIVTAQPRSLESVAQFCGGEASSIYVDDSGLLVDLSLGTDSLLCVVREVFPDKTDQHSVTLMVDEGRSRTQVIDGRDVKTGQIGGGRFVFIGAR